MATKLGGYLFKRESDYQAAKDALYNQMYSDYNNSDKIYFYGGYSYGGGGYLIEIYDECSDPRLAGKICSTYNGEPYNR
jgi:hypothetical protein